MIPHAPLLGGSELMELERVTKKGIHMSKANDKKSKAGSGKSQPALSAYKQAQSKPATTVMPFANKKTGIKKK